MGILHKIGSGLDSCIGVFSPRQAYIRKAARSVLYAAAKTPRTSSDWSLVNTPNVNDIVSGSQATIKARIRQLVRDFPYFARAINNIVDYSVGTGITYQCRISTKAGKLDKPRIQAVEDAFSFWADEADISGQLHYYDLMRLAKRQDVESGEFLLIKKYPKDKTRYLPFALQAYETDWLTDLGAIPANKDNAIKMGIEYQKSTGRSVAYHFTDPDAWGKTQRVLAEDVIFGHDIHRPGQLRGISPFVTAVMMAHDLGDLMDSEMDGAKMASKWLAVVETDDILARQLGTVSTDAVTGNKIEEMENAIIEYLKPGEKMEFKASPRPGTNFQPYVRLILTMISVATGVPYELLTGDYQGMNYSTGKMVRNDFSHSLRPISIRHIRQFATPTLRPFMDYAVLNNKISLPNYFTNPAPYLRAEWQPPGMESVDPAREAKAMIDQMRSGLRSPQEIARARGRDLEDIYKELKAAKEMADEYGLDFAEVSTALANNPAALENQKKSDSTDLSLGPTDHQNKIEQISDKFSEVQ